MRNHATHRSKLDKMITIQKIQFTGKIGEITDKTPPVKCKCVNEKCNKRKQARLKLPFHTVFLFPRVRGLKRNED